MFEWTRPSLSHKNTTSKPFAKTHLSNDKPQPHLFHMQRVIRAAVDLKAPTTAFSRAMSDHNSG